MKRLSVCALILACSSDPGTRTGSSTGGSQPSSGPSAGTDITSTTGPKGTSTSTGPDDDPLGTDFIADPDGLPERIECSIFEQDCPRGEKCTAWGNDGGTWNATRCVPVDPAPDRVGESCTFEESPVSGLDSCELGSMCWDLDPETGEGTCVAFCRDEVPALTCDDPNDYCNPGGQEGVLSLCFPQCDPLLPDTCPSGLGCYPGFADEFRCLVPGRAEAFDTCAGLGACAPGLVCADAADVGLCDADATACCTPACDLDAPNCPNGTSCVPFDFAGDPAPIHERLGLCGQEPA